MVKRRRPTQGILVEQMEELSAAFKEFGRLVWNDRSFVAFMTGIWMGMLVMLIIFLIGMR